MQSAYGVGFYCIIKASRFKHKVTVDETQRRQNRDRLSETLTPEMQTVLETYDDNINETISIAEMEAFRYGVRFGIRLMMETGGSLECPSA